MVLQHARSSRDKEQILFDYLDVVLHENYEKKVMWAVAISEHAKETAIKITSKRW